MTISNRPGTASPVKGKLRQRLTRLPEALLLTVPMLFGAACAAAIQQDRHPMSRGRGPRGGDRCRRSFVLPILPISRRGVEANGGHLYVRDIPGTGCVFTIDLPRAI